MRMNALFDTPADFAVPGLVVLGVEVFFEAWVFFAIFLAGFVGFDIPRTLDTFLAFVSCPAAFAWAITSITDVLGGRERMNVVRSDGGRGMIWHTT
jgi:hypothetical protein